MDKENIRKFVDQAILKWWNTLSDRIEQIKKLEKKPVLIALSRKMPRFIEYLEQEWSDLPGMDVFRECELTTELSIPFRVAASFDKKESSQKDEEKPEEKECYILLDDIIIHGTTLKSVASDLELLIKDDEDTRLCSSCYLSTIFLYRRPHYMPSCVSMVDIVDVEVLDLKTTKAVIKELAERIREISLPLDLEYPILRIMKDDENEEGVIDEVYEHFQKIAFESSKVYINPYKGKWNNTVSVILNKLDERFAPDFTKIRFFDNSEKDKSEENKPEKYSSSFEFFSPYTLPDFLSVGVEKDIFKDQAYSDLWKTVVSSLFKFSQEKSSLFDEINGESLRRNMSRSLVVWANYLLSLSYLMKNCYEMIPDKMKSKIRIEDKDIQLILGENFKDEIKAKLERIVAEKQFADVDIVNEFGGIEAFAPEAFETRYDMLKARLASHSERVEDVLSGIFEFQNFANSLYDRPEYRFDRLFYGETYTSLIYACKPYFEGKEDEKQINQWIDDQIDNGGVIPKYEQYNSPDGMRRWRRFFHAGLNSVYY